MENKRFDWIIVVCMVLLSTVVVAQDNRPLTNQDVIKMVKAGLPENTIVLAIQKSPSKFDTSPDALIALKEAGATQKVLDAILQARSSPNVQGTAADLEDRLQALSDASSKTLKIGTYKTRGVLETTPSGIRESPLIQLKIESVDQDGNVKATLLRNNQKGQLKGKIDAAGKLKLEGYILSLYRDEYQVSLTAIVEDNTLTNGKYTLKMATLEWGIKGAFSTSEWEDDN